MDSKKRDVLWIIAIFALLIILTGIILELDLWVHIQSVMRLEVVWFLSALFILSFIIGAIIIHHKKVSKKTKIFHEFLNLPHPEKVSLIVFIFAIILMLLSVFLTRTKGISFTGFEREEEWFIIIIALITYIYLIVRMLKKE